jgi:hypothetical protein
VRRFLLNKVGKGSEDDGLQNRDQRPSFSLDDAIAKNHLLRRMNVFVTAALAGLHRKLRPFYGDIGQQGAQEATSTSVTKNVDAGRYIDY